MVSSERYLEARLNARDTFMTKRPTRRAVPLAIACAWLACALPAAAAPGASAAPASAPAAQSVPAASAATQYTVKPGQSLADIAATVTGSHDKAVLGRAARSIFDANPSAFMRNDPSLLKLGAVLNVPALDATGAIAKAEPAPAAASASATASAASAAPASQAAAATGGTAGAKPTPVPAAKGASAPVTAISPAPGSAAAGAPASAPAVGAPAKAAPASTAAAAHPPANGATGEHAWSGAIQPAPAVPASAEASASAPMSAATAASAAAASGGAAVSGGVAASAPAAAVSEAPASAAASAAGPASASTSVPKPSAAASSVAAPAGGALHPKVSSLQQLLTLKNRVLMELQRHGFGAPSAGHPGATAGAPASASSFAAAPTSGAAAAPGASRTAAAANQRFIGIGDYGISLTRNGIAAVAAIVAAIVAALLVVLIALGMGRRRRRAPATAGAANGSAASTVAPALGDDAAQAGATSVAAAPDDPVAAEFLAILARNPSSKRALMGLAAHYAERKNVQGFDEIAQRIYRLSGGRGPNWVHIAAIGRELDPDNSLYALEAGQAEEAVLSPDDESEAPVAPASTDAELHAALTPAEAPALPDEGREVPPDTDASRLAGRASTDEPSIEEAPAEEAVHAEPELHEPATPLEPAAAAAPESEATLPPDAMAALGGLEIGLPPRVGAGPESPVHPAEPEPGELEEEGHGEPVPEWTADAGAPTHEAAPPAHADENDEAAHEAQAPPAAPAAAPAVTGLGAAPVGRLNLSFDLDLPGAQAGEGEKESTGADEQGDISPVPQFTPEQLARIARNKLDLAAEYIALGDLGGARTLIHEVIDSNDAATHDEAHAMLATLAPLS